MRRYTIEIAGESYIIDVQEITADRYQVTADGQEFEVRLSGDEDVAEAAIRPDIIPLRPGPPAPAAPRRPAASPALPGPPAPALGARLRRAAPPRPPAPPARGAPPRSGQAAGMLTAPMPGKVLKVEVAQGARVTRGQSLLVLEAMKMKNSIRAPQDCTVLEVLVQPGQSVAYGDALLRLSEG
jgi:biotin carboxyl carrier protein